MVEILGNKLCMESLQSDIQDVQWTINDILSRTGPVQFSSWKFPDKLSWELDMEGLLEMYCFSPNETEENQVAHIALYELLIDRLVLLLQGTGIYLNQIQQACKTGTETTSQPSTSVGLATRYFWSQLINLQTFVQQLNSQNKSNSKRVLDLEKSLKKFASDDTQEISLLSPLSLTSGNSVKSEMSKSMASTRFISRDECNKSSQTVETAFVPCESCDVVQVKMREAGDIIIEICQSQGLPSTLRKYRSQVSHVQWLSYNDVSRWMAEQNKDVHRLSKHMEFMASTIEPLKSQVAAFEHETQRAEHRAKACETDLKLERETQVAIRKQYEVKLKEKEKHHTQNLAELHHEKEQLLLKYSSLETELFQHKSHSTQLHEQLLLLEVKSKKLEQELKEKMESVARLEGAEQEAASLHKQLADTKSQLEETSKALAKEQGRNKSVAQHNQHIHAKQESLSTRVQELGQENEELKEQVCILEEEKQELQETLQETKALTKQLQDEKKQQEVIIQHLREEKAKLEQNIQETEAQIQKLATQIEEAKERERMLIEYPDLHGPVNPDLHGSGDIAVDMENQVKANIVRIQVLEEENEKLRRSVSKVLALGGSTMQTHKSAQPIPLWQSDYLLENRDHHSDPVPEPGQQNSILPRPASKTATSSFTVGKATQENSRTRGTQKRPPSLGKGSGGGNSDAGSYGGLTPVNATTIGAYKQIKKLLGQTLPPHPKSAKEKPHQNNHIAHEVSPSVIKVNKDYQSYPSPTFMCKNCDKMYTSARDLDIHTSYCSG